MTPITSENQTSLNHSEPLQLESDQDERLKECLDLHFHPEHGSRYWLKRELDLGWDVRDRIRSFGDLHLLGLTDAKELSLHSVWDFLPQSFRKSRSQCTIAETGGTSGRPVCSLYTQKDFHRAFIAPFIQAASRSGFPLELEWLWVGPSGPHVIGKVVREIARETGSPDPWSVDFDPRWVKKLKPNSMGQKRYLSHVIDQVLHILDRESPEVIFTTPPVLTELAKRLSPAERSHFQGVHYGGIKVTAEEINQFRKLFPNAVHLSGYGNSLCGVAMEVEDEIRSHIDYFIYGKRMIYQVVRKCPGSDQWVSVNDQETGRVLFHRLDESMFLPGFLERDEAVRIQTIPELQREGWQETGLRDPGPPEDQSANLKTGIY